MKIPSNQYFNNLLNQYYVPNPIRRHCEVVTEVGVTLANHLLQAGVDIEVPLVEAGCRVHDVFKVASLKELTPIPALDYVPTKEEIAVHKELSERFQGVHETLIAAQMLQSEYPEFADFISRIGSTGNPCYLEEGIELKVIHYADWRVQLDKIISYDDRLAYLCETYKDSWKKTGISWETRYEQEKGIEREIFKELDYAPDDLAQIVEPKREVLKIIKEGNPLLRQKSVEVKEITEKEKKLINDMYATFKSVDGMGIAAVQVGVLKRIIVIECDGKLYNIINPKIISSSGKQRFFEACFSVGADNEYVGVFTIRPHKIKVIGLDENGNKIEIEAEDMLAIMLSHEIDHLDGVLFIDKLDGELIKFDSREERRKYREQNPLKVL